MSFTVELPPDIEAQVRTIPDLDRRVLSFLRSQVEYEKWRVRRYSEKARSIVREGLGDAERMKAAGLSREEMFRRSSRRSHRSADGRRPRGGGGYWRHLDPATGFFHLPRMAAAKPSSRVDTRLIYCGDNLDQLAKLPAQCVDLIYIDPPFNSNRNYEVFWGETREKRSIEKRRPSSVWNSCCQAAEFGLICLLRLTQRLSNGMKCCAGM